MSNIYDPTCAIHGTPLRDGHCPFCTTAASGAVPIPSRAPVPAAPAPEATREADDVAMLLDEMDADVCMFDEIRGDPDKDTSDFFPNTLDLIRRLRAAIDAERAALSRENETLRARAEKAERRLADANETARRLCRDRDALLTAARDLLNAVERGVEYGRALPPKPCTCGLDAHLTGGQA